MRYSKETIESIREDIKEGMGKDAIKEKYNCTEYVYLKAATPDTRSLSKEEKKNIVCQYFSGKSKVELAIMFNTSFSSIASVINNNNLDNRRKMSEKCEKTKDAMPMEEISEIIEEITNSSLTYLEIAEKHSTTKAVINSIADSCGRPRNGKNANMTGMRKKPVYKEKNISTESRSNTKVSHPDYKEIRNSNIQFNKYSASIPTFSCGLSYSSKQMPVKDYIFKDNIKNIFDFSTLEKTIISFLNEHKVLVNGVVKQNLEVYNYGLPMCLTSLIKVCNENKINITIYHYNQETYKYIPEVVFNQFGQNTNKFSGMFHQDQINHDIYIQDKDDTEFDNSRFYIVRYKKNTTIDGYIFRNLGDLFNHLKSINDETIKISNKDFNVSIFVEEGHIENSKYVKDQVLYRIMNY